MRVGELRPHSASLCLLRLQSTSREKKRCRNQTITAEKTGAGGQGEAAQRGQGAEGGRVQRATHRSRREESRGVDTERSHHIGVPAALLSSAPFE